MHMLNPYTLPSGLFCMLFCHLLLFCFFQNQIFQKNLSGMPSVSKSLDPDHAQPFVSPNLGPNCLQRLSAEDTSRQTVINVLEPLDPTEISSYSVSIRVPWPFIVT